MLCPSSLCSLERDDQLAEVVCILQRRKGILRIRKVECLINYRVDVVFCEGLLSFAAIIGWMQTLPPTIAFRVHAAKSASIVGSDDRSSRGTVIS